MVHNLDGSLVRIMRHGLHLGKILYFALIDLIRLVSAPAVDEDLPDITVHEAVHIEVRRDIESVQFAYRSSVLVERTDGKLYERGRNGSEQHERKDESEEKQTR